MGFSGGGYPSRLRPTYVQIDLGALARNYERIRTLVAPRRVWCVVKADGYGHGAVEVARRLATAGADAFAVATIDEGIELREAGITADVLLMGGIEPLPAEAAPEATAAVVHHGLAVAVWGREGAAALAEAARRAGGEPVAVHLKVDTGMGRLGVRVDDAVDDAVEMDAGIAALEGVRLAGIFSNLAAADAPAGADGHAHTELQIDRFGALCVALHGRGLLPAERHLANSAGVQQHGGAWRADWCNGVRPGLALYGASLIGAMREAGTTPSGEWPPLEPVMSWHSSVAAVREVPAGWPLGYGAQRRAGRDSRIAVVPVGYHDGLPRAAGDRAEVLVCGRRAKVVGAISMDLTLVDITGIPDARVGAPVVVFGSGQGPGAGSIRVEEVAAWAGSIAHEVLCRVSKRVPRRFVDAAP